MAVRLFVNCMTRGPGARVAATLELLRPAVDEILVALDERAGPEVAAALAPVADRLVRYPYAEPVDRPLAWLHAECAGERVLFSWDTKPPDPHPRALPIRLHARWVSEALYRMWRSGVSLVTWFQLRDEPYPASSYQSGLYFRGGQDLLRDEPKP